MYSIEICLTRLNSIDCTLIKACLVDKYAFINPFRAFQALIKNINWILGFALCNQLKITKLWKILKIKTSSMNLIKHVRWTWLSSNKFSCNPGQNVTQGKTCSYSSNAAFRANYDNVNMRCLSTALHTCPNIYIGWSRPPSN